MICYRIRLPVTGRPIPQRLSTPMSDDEDYSAVKRLDKNVINGSK